MRTSNALEPIPDFLGDVSQNVIRSNLRLYLTQRDRNPDLIKRLGDGYCSGIAVLWAYSRWLYFQPKSSDAVRDDYVWFVNTLNVITSWSGESLSAEEEADIERFISHIEYAQHIYRYHRVLQGDLHRLKALGAGEFIADLEELYVVGGAFSRAGLASLIESTLQTDCWLWFSVPGYPESHAVAVYKQGGDYYFFDSNSGTGEVKTASVSLVARLVFLANYDRHNKPLNEEALASISFKVFGIKPSSDVKAYYRNLKHKDLFLEAEERDRSAAKERGASYYPGLARGALTALYSAARINSLESLAYFLSKGHDPNQADDQGRTPLRIAGLQNNSVAMQMLLNAGADSTQMPGSLFSRIVDAAAEGRDLELADILEQAPDSINMQDKKGMTPLMHLALRGDINGLYKLIEFGGDAEQKDKEGNSALHHAVSYGRLDVIKFLVWRSPQSIDSVNSRGQTSLILAVKFGDAATARQLISYGADLTIGDQSGNTVFHYAVLYRQVALLSILAESSESNVNAFNKQGETALMCAVKTHNKNAIIALLGCDASLSIQDQDGNTALHHAARLGFDANVFGFLLSQPRVLNIKNNQGETPFLVALRVRHFETARYLIERGSNLVLMNQSDREVFSDLFEGSGTQLISYLVCELKSFRYLGDEKLLHRKHFSSIFHVRGRHALSVSHCMANLSKLESRCSNLDWAAASREFMGIFSEIKNELTQRGSVRCLERLSSFEEKYMSLMSIMKNECSGRISPASVVEFSRVS